MSTSDGVSSTGAAPPLSSPEQVRFLEAEVSDLRLRLSESPAGSRGLESSDLPRPSVRWRG